MEGAGSRSRSNAKCLSGGVLPSISAAEAADPTKLQRALYGSDGTAPTEKACQDYRW